MTFTECQKNGTEIVPVFGSGQSWNVDKHIMKNFKAGEMWFLQWMLQVPFRARVTNNDWQEKVNVSKAHDYNKEMH